MGIINELIFNNLKNSYRKLFYKKIILSNIIFFFSILYTLIFLIKLAYRLKFFISSDNVRLYIGSFFFISVVASLDLLIKIVFSKVKVSNIYPYLRLKIQKEKIAIYIILLNHINLKNCIGILILLPVAIVCVGNIGILDIILILMMLLIFFLFNNYISMLCDINRVKLHFLLAISTVLLLFYLSSNDIYWSKHILSNESGTIQALLFILLLIIGTILSHNLLKKQIMKLLYIN